MNDKPDLKRVMAKIAKLLTLSNDSGATEAEAASAAAIAQGLLAEYNLSMSDIETSKEVFIMDGDLETDSLPWRRPLATIVAQLYFCEYFYTFKKYHASSRQNGYVRKDVHTFVGEAHNVVVAKLMFTYLLNTIEQLATTGSMMYPIKERSKYLVSFKGACANRLCWRIQERLDEAKEGTVKLESGTTLPALASMYEQAKAKVDAFIVGKLGEPTREVAPRITRSHDGGVRDGDAAGKKIGLDQQVKADKQQRLGGS